jgi:uncharacterized coiled-coil protein SlyX
MYGAKLEVHAGFKRELTKADQTNSVPSFWFKHTKKKSDAVEEEWKSATDEQKSQTVELKVLQEQDTIEDSYTQVKDLVERYKKLERSFSSDFEVETEGGWTRGPTIQIKATSKLSVASRGNSLELNGSHAKLFRGSDFVSCEPGKVSINGTVVEAG